MTESEHDPPSQVNDDGGGEDDASAAQGGRRRRRRRPRGGRPKGKPKSDFKGTISDMDGHVFQTFNESENRSQFNKTCEQLGRYINKTLDSPGDLLPLYTKHELPNISEPSPLSDEDKKDKMKKLLWIEFVKTYHKRKTSLQDNIQHVYSVIWGQCSPALQAKIKQHENYEANTVKCDCGWLLKTIQSTMFKFEEKKTSSSW